jgi:ankyrin repeat protein
MKLLNYFAIFFLGLASSHLSAFAQTSDQITSFAKASKFDDVSEVKSLLQAGISPNAVDPNGEPMLVLAVKDKSSKVIELLLKDKNIDVDLSNNHGETPLMIASIQDDLPTVKALVLQNKARIDHIGWTPLHYACTKGHLEVAQFLVSNGAIVDSRSLNGTTPLMMAVQSGNENLVKFLLDQGADLQIKNGLGLTAIDIAEIYQKPGISEGLKSRWQRLYKEKYVGATKAKPIDPS